MKTKEVLGRELCWKDGLQLFNNAMNNVLSNHPFVGGVLRRMIITPSESVPTMGVLIDTKSLRPTLKYNPYWIQGFEYEDDDKNKVFFDKMDVNTISSVIIHEIYHICLNHCLRLADRPPQKANIALDVIVNSYIQPFAGPKAKGEITEFLMNKHRFPSLKDLEISDLTSEQVYNILEKADEFKLGGAFDTHEFDLSGLTPEQREKVRVNTDDMMRKSSRENKNLSNSTQWGNIPGELSQYINAVNNPKSNWKSTINSFMRTCKVAKVRTSWKRPSRRLGYTAPCRTREIKPNIIIICDTSGSVFSEEALGEFASYINFAMKECESIRVISIDTKINYNKKIDKYDLNWYKDFAKGGGGTQLQPAFEEAIKHKPDGIICLTDGYCDDINTYGIPTIALLSEGGVCPNGISQSQKLK